MESLLQGGQIKTVSYGSTCRKPILDRFKANSQNEFEIDMIPNQDFDEGLQKKFQKNSGIAPNPYFYWVNKKPENQLPVGVHGLIQFILYLDQIGYKILSQKRPWIRHRVILKCWTDWVRFMDKIPKNFVLPISFLQKVRQKPW